MRALNTLNKTTACSFLSSIIHTFIEEKLYGITEELYLKYLIESNFNFHMICLYTQSTAKNSLVITLFNNNEMIINFILKLKSSLEIEAKDLFNEENIEMVNACLEDLERSSVKKFKELKENMMMKLGELIQITLVNEF